MCSQLPCDFYPQCSSCSMMFAQNKQSGSIEIEDHMGRMNNVCRFHSFMLQSFHSRRGPIQSTRAYGVSTNLLRAIFTVTSPTLVMIQRCSVSSCSPSQLCPLTSHGYPHLSLYLFCFSFSEVIFFHMPYFVSLLDYGSSKQRTRTSYLSCSILIMKL